MRWYTIEEKEPPVMEQAIYRLAKSGIICFGMYSCHIDEKTGEKTGHLTVLEISPWSPKKTWTGTIENADVWCPIPKIPDMKKTDETNRFDMMDMEE